YIEELKLKGYEEVTR
ncbi:hypothetical protein KQY44_003114, partial [Listeria monocytogenes]|nr:hypothetical protein [Listeria monocytogenes]EHQ4782543.1 hypothetical protein [Listeria monocytogenes]